MTRKNKILGILFTILLFLVISYFIIHYVRSNQEGFGIIDQDDYVFIMTRHVNSETTDNYWKECYKNIRNSYPDKSIVIIDDNSNYDYISNLQNSLIFEENLNKELTKKIMNNSPILSLRNITISFAKKILFSTADKFSFESITLDTVLRFKGMESPFVILYADRDLADHAEMSYVATSRARSHLYIVGSVSGTILGSALEKNS